VAGFVLQLAGNWTEFDKAWVLDPLILANLPEATQHETAAALELRNQSPLWRQSLARLKGELAQCGGGDVLGEGGSSIAPIPQGVRRKCVFLIALSTGS
jgi:hypothetical protein